MSVYIALAHRRAAFAAGKSRYLPQVIPCGHHVCRGIHYYTLVMIICP